eukprot:1980490-Amphidinium_carterae.1
MESLAWGTLRFSLEGSLRWDPFVHLNVPFRETRPCPTTCGVRSGVLRYVPRCATGSSHANPAFIRPAVVLDDARDAIP